MPSLTAQFITQLVERAVRGEITSTDVANTLLERLDEVSITSVPSVSSKNKSDGRLRDLCVQLQQEGDAAKILAIKDRLSHEFYVCGEADLIKTFLPKGRLPTGQEVL